DDLILEALTELAALDNVSVWFSADRDTGLPPEVPERVRVCWLMVEEDDHPPQPVNLVFRTRPLRWTVATRVTLSVVCPSENGRGRHVTCSQCRRCVTAPDPERK